MLRCSNFLGWATRLAPSWGRACSKTTPWRSISPGSSFMWARSTARSSRRTDGGDSVPPGGQGSAFLHVVVPILQVVHVLLGVGVNGFPFRIGVADFLGPETASGRRVLMDAHDSIFGHGDRFVAWRLSGCRRLRHRAARHGEQAAHGDHKIPEYPHGHPPIIPAEPTLRPGSCRDFFALHH